VFKSGAITAIGSGGNLQLDGAQARVSIGAGTTNSALSALAVNYGALGLQGDTSNGAGGSTITTTAGLTNYGTIDLDTNDGEGGSALRIGGALINLGVMHIGCNLLGAATTVTATGLASSGTLIVQGNGESGTTTEATLNIAGAAPTVLVGNNTVAGDADWVFKSGGITQIGNSANLVLDGAQARVSIGAGTTNSALTGLASNYGYLGWTATRPMGPADRRSRRRWGSPTSARLASTPATTRAAAH